MVNIEALSVLNELYHLDLTTTEFDKIKAEINYKNKKGLFCVGQVKDKTILVAHDFRHDIIFKDTNELITMLKTNKIDLQAQDLPNSWIILKTLITFDFNGLKEAEQEHIFNLHRILKYRSDDFEVQFRADNLEQLKEIIRKRLCEGKHIELEGYTDEYSGFDYDKRKKILTNKREAVKEQLRAIFWLFEKEQEFESFEKEIYEKSYIPNISLINKVLELNNKRLAIIRTNEEFTKRHSSFYRSTDEEVEGIRVAIQGFHTNDERYNYTDEGREVYQSKWNTSQIWVTDEVKGKLTNSELDLIYERLRRTNEYVADKFILLTQEKYEQLRNILRSEMIKRKLDEKQERNEEFIKQKLKEKLGKEGVVKKDFLIKTDSITYKKGEESYCIKGSYVSDFISFNQIYSQENLDFNNMFANYIEYLRKNYVDNSYVKDRYDSMVKDEKYEFEVLGYPIKIKPINKRHYINDIKINKEDLFKCLYFSKDYKTSKEYNAFLKDISKENFKVKSILKDGLSFQFIFNFDEFNFKSNKAQKKLENEKKGKEKEMEKSFIVSLPVFKKDKYYTKLNDKEFKIKSLSTFIDLENVSQKDLSYRGQNMSYFGRIVKRLYLSLEGLTAQDIGLLIENGKAEHNKRLGRAREFLRIAVENCKAEKMKINGEYGSDIEGYKVIGKSGIIYFICEDLKCYVLEKNKDGKDKLGNYICIVEISPIRFDYQMFDRLASRITFLYNDKSVASEVFTIEQVIKEKNENINENEVVLNE